MSRCQRKKVTRPSLSVAFMKRLKKRTRQNMSPLANVNETVSSEIRPDVPYRVFICS